MRYYSVLGSDPIFFISWALLALTPSLGTLPGSAWSLCHMLLNNTQGFIWTWSTSSTKQFHLWQPPAWGSTPGPRQCLCWRMRATADPSEEGDFSSGCLTLHRQILRIKEDFFPSGVILPQPSFQSHYEICEGLINLWTLLLHWKKVSVFKISPSLVLVAKNHLHLTEILYLKWMEFVIRPSHTTFAVSQYIFAVIRLPLLSFTRPPQQAVALFFSFYSMETRKYHPCKLLDFPVMFHNPRSFWKQEKLLTSMPSTWWKQVQLKFTPHHTWWLVQDTQRRHHLGNTLNLYHFHLFLLAPDKAGWEWGQEAAAETKQWGHCKGEWHTL